MNQQSITYKFLLAPQFRIWRYSTLIIFFVIVSLNQALVGYKDIMPLMGNRIYWIVAGTILVYIITIFLLNKIILKYLLSGQYLLFVLSIVSCALLFIVVPNITYYTYIPNYDLFSNITLIDNLSAFVIYILCISGVIIPVFLKNWMISNQHLNQLKRKQASSQVEKFKEQINPPSFFKILSKSKYYVNAKPDKASIMLMNLGQLLRYQLYDCNRPQVLLTAEISFLRNFLELEKLYSLKFDYSITIDGSIVGIFISPLVLLPYAQSAINAFDHEKEHQSVNIKLSNVEDTVCIILEIVGANNQILLEKEFPKVKERLNALYKDCYDVTISSDKYGKTEMILHLEKKMVYAGLRS